MNDSARQRSLSRSQKTVILDTNVLIHVFDYPVTATETGHRASQAHRALEKLGYTIAIAKGTYEDISRSRSRAETRSRELERYPVVAPQDAGDLRERAESPSPMSVSDQSDLQILAVIDQGLADWLITEDKSLKKHALKAELQNVVTLDEFLEIIQPALTTPSIPPEVTRPDAASINLNSPFFRSLKSSYPEFHDWWQSKVIAQDRDILLLGEPNDPRGIAVVKQHDPDYGLPEDTAKICTFKIDKDLGGKRFGESLLSALLGALRAIPSTTAFLEVAPDNFLVSWLKNFGFYILPRKQAANGDIVMVKDLAPTRHPDIIDPWEFHKHFGPGRCKARRAFLIPIQTKWHERLFPDPETPTLGSGLLAESCGNAITKAYICNSNIRRIQAGDLLLFVESATRQRITNIGVAEDIAPFTDPIALSQYVSDRSVYPLKALKELTENKTALAIRFRHDRRLAHPWGHNLTGYSDLVGHAPAQTIQQVKPEGIKWLQAQMAALH